MTYKQDDDKFLAELVDSILEGKAAPGGVDEGVDAERRAALRQAEILARIADLHQHLPADDTALGGGVETGSVPLSWGRLTILEELGRGAFGAVYRARDRRLDREVALKLLWPGRADPDRFIASMVEEGRLLARIHHPNVVTIYDANVIDGRVGLTMEFVRGQTLSQEFQARGPFTPSDAAAVGIEVARALAAVHEAGLLHRDVKTQNVMRRTDGRLVLMDFGAGRRADGSGDDAAITGTPLYLAPEVLDGQRATVQSDVYSLGVLLFYLLTGTYPVSGHTIRELRDAHRAGRRMSLGELRPDVPPALAAIIDRALAATPSDRWASAGDMAAALVSADGPSRPSWTSRLFASIAVIAALGAALAFVLGRQERAEEGTTTISRLPFSADFWSAGRLSRDGRHLPFSVGQGSRLMIRDLMSGTDRTLLAAEAGSGWIEYAVVSRDNSYVAYSWDTASGRELRVIETGSAGNQRVLLRDEARGPVPGAVIEPVDWTPDGSAILALRSQTGESYDVVLVDVAEGTVRTLKRALPWRVFMSLSHDGRFVAFDHPDPSAEYARDISILTIDGGEEYPVVTGATQDSLPVWMADDGGLLYTSDRSGTYGLLMTPVQDGRPAGPPRVIRRDSGRILTMSLGDDGTLFHLMENGTMDVQTASIGVDGAIDAATIAVAATHYVGANLDPAWSPDGRALAYVSRRRMMGPRRHALVIVSASDRNERLLWPDLDGFIEPRWSPDGRQFLLRGNDNRGRRGPWLIDAASGNVLARVGGPGFPDMEWARDGRSLFVIAQNRVGRFDLASARIQDIHRDARKRTISELAVTADERWLAITLDEGDRRSIEVLPATGGPAREVFSTTRPDAFLLQEWTRDGMHLLMSRGQYHESGYIRGDWSVWSVPAAGGTPRPLNLTGPRLRGVTVSPDGSRLAYRVGDPGADTWVMRNFLP